jgi:hypothetical protein
MDNELRDVLLRLVLRKFAGYRENKAKEYETHDLNTRKRQRV